MRRRLASPPPVAREGWARGGSTYSTFVSGRRPSPLPFPRERGEGEDAAVSEREQEAVRRPVHPAAASNCGKALALATTFQLTDRGSAKDKPATPRGSRLEAFSLSSEMGECPERQRGRTVNPLAMPS
jgi:hypothetical protein